MRGISPLFLLFCVFRGGDSHVLFEKATEIGGVFKAYGKGDFADREVSCGEKRGGAAENQTISILQRRHARFFAEETVEVALAFKTALQGDFNQVKG